MQIFVYIYIIYLHAGTNHLVNKLAKYHNVVDTYTFHFWSSSMSWFVGRGLVQNAAMKRMESRLFFPLGNKKFWYSFWR